MYGFQNFVHITPEQLLRVVDQKAVFEYIFEHSIDVENRYTSPFRPDRNPQCFFETREDGTLLFMDFGESSDKKHRSCIKAIMEFEKLSFDGAVQFIYHRFRKESSMSLESLSDSPTYTKTPKKNSVLTYTKRDYAKKDSLLWSKWLITPNQLLQDNVFAVKRFFTRSSKGSFYFYPKLGYAIDFVDAVKIYQPTLTEKGKWITNCNENHIGNIDNISVKGSQLIITKSYKDHRVLRNTLPNLDVVWFQNEGCIPDDEIMEELSQRFSNIVVFYDNDSTGVEASDKLCKEFNTIRANSATSICLPKKSKHKELFGNYLKDSAEYINKEGKEYLQKTLKKLGL